MAGQITVNFTEVTMVGKSKQFKLTVANDETVSIPVDEAIFTHYQNQFCRGNPSQLQKQRFNTLLNLMRAAYKQGIKDGKN